MELSLKQYEDIGRKFCSYFLQDKVINTVQNRKNLLATLKKTQYRFNKDDITFVISEATQQMYFLWCCKKSKVATNGFNGDEVKMSYDNFIKVIKSTFFIGDWEKARRANKLLYKLSTKNFTSSFKNVLKHLLNSEYGTVLEKAPNLLKATLRVLEYRRRT